MPLVVRGAGRHTAVQEATMGASARVLAPSPLDSEAGVSAGFELIEIRSEQVDQEMIIAGESSGIPEVLQGLWWMDGNPLPDEVISLGGSTWDPETRSHQHGGSRHLNERARYSGGEAWTDLAEWCRPSGLEPSTGCPPSGGL
jgi:hypothetical protein